MSSSQGTVGKIFTSAVHAPGNYGIEGNWGLIWDGLTLYCRGCPEPASLCITKEFTAPTCPVWVGMKLKIFHPRLGASGTFLALPQREAEAPGFYKPSGGRWKSGADQGFLQSAGQERMGQETGSDPRQSAHE